MTLHTIDAELLVTEPGSGASIADFRVPAADIESVDVRERAGRDVAEGTIIIDNASRAYTLGSFPIDYDDEIVFRVAWEGGGRNFGFGDQAFGEGGFGTGTWNTSSTLIVTSWQVTGPKWASTLNLTAENFVFNRLREQTVNEYSALDAPISGSADAHLNTVLADYVPNVGTSQLPTISETIDYSVDKKEARKVVAELARLAHDATGTSWIVGADGTDLTVTDVGALTPQWTAGESTSQVDFHGGFQHSSAADDLVNEVRVEGGIDPANVDDSQTTQSSSQTVTNSSRLTARVDSRKSELPQIEVYAIEKANSDDDLRVRLQADDGNGSPIAVSDTESDIINQSQAVPSGQDGFLTFEMGDHTIAPRKRPHLIIDSAGSTGQDVGTDGNGNAAYKVHFAKPVIVSLPDNTSQSDFREHDKTISDENLRTFNAARNRARRELDRRSVPKRIISGAQAESRRAHELTVGDVITLDYPWLRATGDYVVSGVEHSYEGSTLDTTVQMRSVARFA